MGAGGVYWSPLLRGIWGIIASPRAPSSRVGIWYIIRVVWGITESKCFSLLPPRQLSHLSSSAGVAAVSAATLRDRPWGGAAPRVGWWFLPPLLARVIPRSGLGWWRHFMPLLPPSFPRKNFLAHAMSVRSSPRGYG